MAHRLLSGAGAALWVGLVLVPLVCLYSAAWRSPLSADAARAADQCLTLLPWSLLLAAGIAAASVVLGYVPGKLLGTAQRGRAALFFVILAPLLLPRYLYYSAWWQLRAPTGMLGSWLNEQPAAVPQAAAAVNAALAMVLWYWPLAALLVAQGWRNVDGEVLRSARLEAGAWQRWTRIVLPMLARPLGLAFVVCFVFILSEYGAFHLARVWTFGAKLGALYAETGQVAAVARAALPLAAVAVLVSLALSKRLEDLSLEAPLDVPAWTRRAWQWWTLAALVALSVAAPLGLLVANVNWAAAAGQFRGLPWDKLLVSLIVAVGGAAVALVMAAGVLATERLGPAGRWPAQVMQAGLLFAMFAPGSLVGAAIKEAQSVLGLGGAPGEAWWILSAGMAVRFAGVALVILRLTRDASERHFAEMAGVDGAGAIQVWRYVHWPRTWPVVAGAGMLVAMFGLTEVPATSILLEPDMPNFAYWLLDRMHFMEEQSVILACLMLVAVYVAPVAVAAAALGARAWRRPNGRRAGEQGNR